MSNIKKIILATRPLKECLNYRAGWFQSLLKYHLEAVSNLPVYNLLPSNFLSIQVEENAIPFDYVKFFKFYGITYNLEAWSELYYVDEYNEQAYEYVRSIFKDSIVISYEMDRCILNILEKLNIPYIDAYISPVRFLEDQLFSMTSNYESIYNKLLEYKLPEEKIYMHANYLKTFYLMRDYKHIQDTPALLFLGQTRFDKSLIDSEGKIYSILDHKEEFENAIKGYGRILYKRHPYVYGDEEVIEYVKSLADVTFVDENFYSLVSRPDIKKVVSISSGGLIEAKYFGKETQFLLHESVNLQYDNKFDKDKYINIYEHFFALHFWADVLSVLIDTKDYPLDYSFYGSKNKLRNSRGSRDWWGYEDFDHEMVKQEICRNIYNSSPNKMLRCLFRILYHMTYNKRFLYLSQKYAPNS